MQKVYIIHGYKGVPNGGWRPWLMGELNKKDIFACVLEMPTPNTPVKREWVKTIRDIVKEQTSEVYLVGHSLGVRAILSYLETVDSPIAGAVLVSGRYYSASDNPSLSSFYEEPIDISKIKSLSKNFVVIHGDNDPHTPLSDAERFAKEIDAEFIVIADGKHLSGHDGFDKFPEVRDVLLKILEK
jgi:predicted alpha/beta hydrolase family esterase